MDTIVLKGSIFISVKELMILEGKDISSDSLYESTRKAHQAIRDSISPRKKKLTVKEYCHYYGLNYEEITEALNSIR